MCVDKLCKSSSSIKTARSLVIHSMGLSNVFVINVCSQPLANRNDVAASYCCSFIVRTTAPQVRLYIMDENICLCGKVGNLLGRLKIQHSSSCCATMQWATRSKVCPQLEDQPDTCMHMPCQSSKIASDKSREKLQANGENKSCSCMCRKISQNVTNKLDVIIMVARAVTIIVAAH